MNKIQKCNKYRVTTLSVCCLVCVAAFHVGGRGRGSSVGWQLLGSLATPGNTWPLWASEPLKALLGSVAGSLSSLTLHPGFWLLFWFVLLHHTTLHIHSFSLAHPTLQNTVM